MVIHIDRCMGQFLAIIYRWGKRNLGTRLHTCKFNITKWLIECITERPRMCQYDTSLSQDQFRIKARRSCLLFLKRCVNIINIILSIFDTRRRFLKAFEHDLNLKLCLIFIYVMNRSKPENPTACFPWNHNFNVELTKWNGRNDNEENLKKNLSNALFAGNTRIFLKMAFS